MIETNIKVLYVEDHLDTQEVFVELLSLLVDEIITASNGKEALELFLAHSPDMLITDIQMPVLSGLEMIGEIRKINQNIPIIITSAFNEKGFLFQAIDLGVDCYLVKPVVVEKLESCIKKIVNSILQQRKVLEYNKCLQRRVEDEKALREAKEQLLIAQNKYVEIGHMVGVIAHQWKQPLHYLNLLIEDIGLESQYNVLDKEYIDTFINKGTAKITFLSETMDNFLNFYKTNLNPSLFSAYKVTKDILEFLSNHYKAIGIEIEVNVVNDFQLFGIENEFQQSILNLINNAKEAFGPNIKADAKIIIDLSSDETQGIIKISDNALGIPEEIMENIFEPEYTTKKNGNGIGLYLVKQLIVNKFNGIIEVQNLAQGVVFTLRFGLKLLENERTKR